MVRYQRCSGCQPEPTSTSSSLLLQETSWPSVPRGRRGTGTPRAVLQFDAADSMRANSMPGQLDANKIVFFQNCYLLISLLCRPTRAVLSLVITFSNDRKISFVDNRLVFFQNCYLLISLLCRPTRAFLSMVITFSNDRKNFIRCQTR